MSGEIHAIRGLVLDDAGHPIPGARVGFAEGPVPLPDIAAVTGPDGVFHLSAPVLGRYSIVCTSPDGARMDQSVDVQSGTEATLTVIIART